MSKETSSQARDILELDIPEGVDSAEQSVELIRAWVADGNLVLSLNSDAFGERLQDWGRLLSQMAGHIAKASALQGYASEGEAEALIRQAFTQSALITPSQPRTTATEGKVRRSQH